MGNLLRAHFILLFSLATSAWALSFTPIIVIDSHTMISEAFPTNGVVDPNEPLVFAIGLRNGGRAAGGNISAELVSANGISSTSGDVSYGNMPTNGTVVTRTFSLSVAGPAGRVRQAEVIIRSSGVEIGRNVFDVPVGGNVVSFSHLQPIWVPLDYVASAGPAGEFPSVIQVAGLSDPIVEARVTMHNYEHEFAEDVNAVLVAPDGTAVMLMSDCGGATAMTNVNLTFVSGLTNLLFNIDRLESGSYAATDYNFPNRMTFPAPTNLPITTTMASFTKLYPNGEWQLFLEDTRIVDSGVLRGGWSLTFTLSKKPLLIATHHQGGTMRVELTDTGGKPYLIDSSTNLTDWEVLGQTPSGAASATFYEVIAGGQRFYRARRITP